MKDFLSASNGCVIALVAALLFAVNLVASPILKIEVPGIVVDKPKSDGTPISGTPDDAKIESESTFAPMIILGHTGKIKLTWAEKMKWELYWDRRFGFGFSMPGSGHFVFTPGRSPQRAMNTPQIASVLVGDDLKKPPPASLEGALLSELGFDLASEGNSAPVKRFDQGVTLRGLNALVLLDGVSVNDPFGGWVPWAAMPREGLARVELVPGGGATAWGNGALGGVIQFLTLPAQGQMISVEVPPVDYDPSEPMPTKNVIHGTTRLTTTFGECGTRSAEFVSSQPTASGVLQVLGRTFRTEGFPVVAAGQRGQIDDTTWNRNWWIEARWRQPLGADAELVATVRGYDEYSGNGTPYQQGGSHGAFASLAVAGHHSTRIDWTALIYLQDCSSTNRFSAVDTSRTTEIPVIDQFALPTKAFGANWTGFWSHGNSKTHAGLEFRSVHGESRDYVDFAQGVFAHELMAGGKNDLFGIFALHDHEFTKYLHTTIGARIDAWHEGDGHRRETDLPTGGIILDQHFESDHEKEFSPSLGVVWQPTKAWSWRANGQQSFRRPTLGELYHSSGSDNIVIAANPGLQTEHSSSFEVATEYSFFRTKTSRDNLDLPVLSFGVKAFVNELRDAIGAVGIVRGTGELPLLDTLPADYIGRKLLNLDRARVQGFEFSVAWQASEKFTFKAGLLLNDARIVRSALSPALEGNQIPEVPRRSASLSSTWKVSEKFSFSLRVRSESRKFLDSENTLPLKATVLADFGLTFRLNPHAELYLTADNVFNCEIETSRSPNGLVYTGSPRLLLGGVRLKL